MAKTTGILKLTGTIGDVNFYLRKGEAVSRAAGGGFNGAAIRTSPRMARVRENGSEFKGCVQTVKYFKAGLQPFLSAVKDGETHQRLVSLFTQLKDLDAVSVRGARFPGGGLSTAAGRQLLNGHVFNSRSSLVRVLGSTFGFDWNTGLTIDRLSEDGIVFPKTATHLELTALWYDFNFNDYSCSLGQSETVLLTANAIPEGALTLAPIVATAGNGAKIGLVVYRFLQEMNGQRYGLKDGLGMEVVFVGE